MTSLSQSIIYLCASSTSVHEQQKMTGNWKKKEKNNILIRFFTFFLLQFCVHFTAMYLNKALTLTKLIYIFLHSLFIFPQKRHVGLQELQQTGVLQQHRQLILQYSRELATKILIYRCVGKNHPKKKFSDLYYAKANNLPQGLRATTFPRAINEHCLLSRQIRDSLLAWSLELRRSLKTAQECHTFINHADIPTHEYTKSLPKKEQDFTNSSVISLHPCKAAGLTFF